MRHRRMLIIKKPLIFIILISFILIGLVYFLINKNKPESEKTPTASVQTVPAQWTEMSDSIITYGTVSFPPDEIHQISIQNEAMVMQIFVIPGQQIKPHDPLVKLSPSSNAKLTIDNTQLAVTFADKELKRISALRKQFLATNAEVQAASQNLEKAKIALLNLQQQQQNQNGTILRSEVEGTVIAVNVSAGQIVAANSVLLNFSNGENRQIRLGVENEDIVKLKVGTKVVVTSLDTELSKHFSVINNITGQVDATTGLIDVIVTVKNAPDLIPGSMVKGEISTQPNTKVIAVPRSAVLYQQKKPYLFVISNKKAVLRWVVVGEDNGQMVSILKGLNAGERVVILGNYELTDGLSVVEQKL